ncbi:MAG TPA: endolytic transglycosylase MltG [Alphaproteobacteria bacterium]|nr:endolytic transglycosylase MltG [Alphaproteobacteria bacterium]
MGQPAPQTPPAGAAPRRGRRLLRFLGVLVLLAALGGGAALWEARRWSSTPGPLAADATVVVPRGTGTRSIATALQEAGVIDRPWLFAVLARFAPDGRPLKAGEYQFTAGIAPGAVLEALRAGRTVARRLTIPEGLTAQQIVELLRAETALSGDVHKLPAEGSLLPDTYHFSYGDSRAAMVERMQTAMREAIAELWPKRAKDLPFDTIEEAVTLASIVEKETGQPEERPRVAGVYVNRLRKGMKLQADPTTIYGITGGKGPLGRSITRADLTDDNPYNTYVITGLPPGPIANPGRESLAAVMNPQSTDELYFVADGTGGHAFARTLAEHNRNVAKWRRIERERARQAGQAAEADDEPQTE